MALHATRLRLFLSAFAAITVLTVLPCASAWASTDTTQFAVVAGTLTFGTAPDVPNLPALTLNGQAQTLNAQMNNYSVGDGSGSGAGFTALFGTTGTAPTHQCGSGCNVDSATAVKTISAAAGAGIGTYQTNSYSATSLGLSAPTTITTLLANEVYRVDLLWSLNSGP